MKKWIAVLAAWMLLASLGGVLHAARFTDKVGGVSLWLPDNWEIDSDEEEGYLNANAPEDDSFCILQVLDVDDLEAARAVYEDVLADEIDDFSSISEDQEAENGGLKTVAITGEGQREDMDWAVRVTLISTGESVLLLTCGWEKAKDTAFAPLAETIVRSLKKLD